MMQSLQHITPSTHSLSQRKTAHSTEQNLEDIIVSHYSEGLVVVLWQLLQALSVLQAT